MHRKNACVKSIFNFRILETTRRPVFDRSDYQRRGDRVLGGRRELSNHRVSAFVGTDRSNFPGGKYFTQNVDGRHSDLGNF